MLEMSWITAILQLYSQIADLFGNVIVKRINIRLFDLLARFHYILNLPRMSIFVKKKTIHSGYVVMKFIYQSQKIHILYTIACRF